MFHLRPDTDSGLSTGLTADELATLYAYPDIMEKPWIQANFVSSVDGGTAVEGRSEGLSNPADKRIFALGRLLCDVVLVGAGTARAEQYGAIFMSASETHHRLDQGLAPAPPIAVVTQSCLLDPAGPLFSEPSAPATLVITCEAAPKSRRDDLLATGAEVITAGAESVDVRDAVNQLGARGLLRVDCEGGPQLFGQLVAADLIDQLCLTIAPLCVGAGPPRMAEGITTTVPQQLILASALHDDGFLMLRYRRGS